MSCKHYLIKIKNPIHRSAPEWILPGDPNWIIVRAWEDDTFRMNGRNLKYSLSEEWIEAAYELPTEVSNQLHLKSFKEVKK